MKENLHKDMDQFFKEKFNNREFEFKEAYWAEMTDLLEEKTERKAVGFPFWKWILSGIVLLVVGASVWSFTNMPIDQTIQQSTVQPVTNTSNVNTLTRGANSMSSTFVTVEEGIDKEDILEVISAEDNPQNELEEKPIQAIDNVVKYNGANTNNKLQLPVKKKAGKRALRNEPSFNPSGEAQKTPFEQALPDFKNILFNNQLPIPMKMEEDKPQASSNIFAETKQVEVKPYLGESLASLDGFLKEEAPVFENLKYPLNVKSSNWRLGILAGLNTAQDYPKFNSDTKSYTTQPIVGLTATYTPHPNWSINSGVLYHARGGVNTTYAIDSIFYAFGASNKRTEVDVTMLHYIEIPLQVGYNFGKRKHHQLTVGVAYSYLMNAYGTSTSLETTAANSLDVDNIYSPTGEVTSWGYQNVFTPHDLSVQLGYNVEVYKDVKIGISANYGLASVGFGYRDQDSDLADMQYALSPSSTPRSFKNIYFRAALTYNLANF